MYVVWMLMTDLGRASENLRPGQSNKDDQRPGTVPRVKKYDFGGQFLLSFLTVTDKKWADELESIICLVTLVLVIFLTATPQK